jgi:hypothetical protein
MERTPEEPEALAPQAQPATPTAGEEGIAELLRAPSGPAGIPHNQLVALQRTAGNQAVLQLLRAVAPPAARERRLARAGDQQGSAEGAPRVVADGASPAPGQIALGQLLDAIERAVCEVAEREAMILTYIPRPSVPGSTDTKLKLAALEASVSAARPALEVSEQEQIVARALDARFEIGLALGAGDTDHAAVQATVDRTADQFALLEQGLTRYIVDAPSPLLAEIVFPDAWREACTARSAVQFAIDLYYGGNPPPDGAADLEYFDELLEHVARRDAPTMPDEAPTGLPKHHWWWRAPYVDRPPGGASGARRDPRGQAAA